MTPPLPIGWQESLTPTTRGCKLSPMDTIDEVLEYLGADDWETDGFGLDSNLIHCDSMIEQDCPRCPECGAPNPLMAAGLI